MNMKVLKKYGLQKHKILGELQKGNDIEWKGKKIKAKDATILQKGTKITYITDTKYFKELEKFSSDSDLLICESTFASDNEDKAKGYTHMTAKEVGKLAKNASVKQLIITHFSHRYKSPSPILKEVKEVLGYWSQHGDGEIRRISKSVMGKTHYGLSRRALFHLKDKAQAKYLIRGSFMYETKFKYYAFWGLCFFPHWLVQRLRKLALILLSNFHL